MRKKHDLTKWKFADLRDTINTSCGEDTDTCIGSRKVTAHALLTYYIYKEGREGSVRRAAGASLDIYRDKTQT